MVRIQFSIQLLDIAAYFTDIYPKVNHFLFSGFLLTNNQKLLKTSSFNLTKYQNPNCTFGPKISEMAIVYFSLGSNEGDRLNWLVKAAKLIENLVGKVIENSSVIESEAWGFESETTFYNMVLLVETELTPQQVLNKVLDIEASLGRTRHGNVYTNRIIDVDILFYNEEQINDEKLVIPHPLMQKRIFVLQPLAEIAADLIHPVLHTSVSALLLRLNESEPIPIIVDRVEFALLLNSINQS
jgi:2-amino-4-hydroxy-6-hydroxymethyldihydropteridine diphosphokinase